jgi:hypothetical protein
MQDSVSRRQNYGKVLTAVAENPGECLESEESNVGVFALSD